MRRKDREIIDLEQLQAILDTCDTCRLAMVDERKPYLIPLSFGYQLDGGRLTLYFHCANEGRKIEILKRSPMICFEMDCHHQFFESDDGSSATMHYSCIIGEGEVQFLTNLAEKDAALHCLLQHYTAKVYPNFPETVLQKTTVLKLSATSFSGKYSC